MTLIHAPWAVDGARITSALARVSTYATGGGRSGIVRPGDLKVSALSVPGNGVRIAGGDAVILNGYQTTPREAYAVANNGTHTVLAADMPPAVPQTAHYLVCIAVGDPEFNQAGHPFMPPEILPEDAADFEYVRPVVVPCSANTERFEQLGLHYPAYALARLEIPPNTSTITDAMITDLREISTPRQERILLSSPTIEQEFINDGNIRPIASYRPTIEVPAWATTMIVVADLHGAAHINPDVSGHLYVHSSANDTLGPGSTYEFPITANPADYDVVTLRASATLDVSSYAGQVTTLSMKARRAGGLGWLRALSENRGSMMTFDVQFVEAVR